MKDIKNKSISTKESVAIKNAAKLPTFKKLNLFKFKYYNILAGGTFGVLLAVYVGSMIGISVFAIQEKSYTVKTSELLSQEISVQNNMNKEDSLALSDLNLNKDRMSHIFISEGNMNSMSRR